MVDVLAIPALLSPQQCAQWRDELDRAAARPATVLDRAEEGRVAAQVRRAARLQPADWVQASTMALLTDQRERLQAHFGIPLGRGETAPFLRYDVGDFFVAHQDGNTPLLRDALLTRRVSLVLFLNDPAPTPGTDGYGGGELVFHPRSDSHAAPSRYSPPAGTLLAFRAETTHEVLPVEHGRRYNIASWLHAAEPA